MLEMVYIVELFIIAQRMVKSNKNTKKKWNQNPVVSKQISNYHKHVLMFFFIKTIIFSSLTKP